MSKKTKLTKKLRIPRYSLIADLGEAADMVMTPEEIDIFSGFFYYPDLDKLCQAYNDREYYVHKYLTSAFKKVIYLLKLPSISDFMEGRLTKKQFLEAPIKYHCFSTGLYHTLIGAEIFNLQELIKLGVEKTKSIRRMGNKGIDEIKETLKKKGCDHLFK